MTIVDREFADVTFVDRDKIISTCKNWPFADLPKLRKSGSASYHTDRNRFVFQFPAVFTLFKKTKSGSIGLTIKETAESAPTRKIGSWNLSLSTTA